MNTIDDYLHAVMHDNTRKSYQAAVRHFEVEWGSFLPATADSIARYLADHAQTHSPASGRTKRCIGSRHSRAERICTEVNDSRKGIVRHRHSA